MAQVSFADKYQLLEVLGSGSCGQVYSASSKRTARDYGSKKAEPLAVKLLDLRQETHDHVLQEIEMLHAVAHNAHCADVVDAFFEEQAAYIVMARYDRPLPVALASQSSLTERTLATFFRQMFQAVAGLNEVGIVHRDVKPDNFMCVGAENTVKLVDFGLATWAPRADQRIKGTCGTPPFMAPEMLRRAGYGTEVDVWSLGVCAYVLLFGEFPYMPEVMDSKSMKAAIASGASAPRFHASPSAEALGAHASVSESAINLVRRLLERDPAKRLTAEQALTHPWTSSGAKAMSPRRLLRSQGCPDLKPALLAAAGVNAFEQTDAFVQLCPAIARAGDTVVRCSSAFTCMLDGLRRKLALPRLRCDPACGQPKPPHAGAARTRVVVLQM